MLSMYDDEFEDGTEVFCVHLALVDRAPYLVLLCSVFGAVLDTFEYACRKVDLPRDCAERLR